MAAALADILLNATDDGTTKLTIAIPKSNTKQPILPH
jgi:hypothetical protein